MNTRLLGTLFLVSSLLVMLNGFRTTALGIKPFEDTLGSAAYFVWGVGGVCGMLGLMQSKALGLNTLARTTGFLPLLGFAAFILGEGMRLAGFISLDSGLYTALTGFAWLAVLAGMLIVGILIIAAKTWRGWQRFVPLLAVVMFPAGIGIGQALGSDYLGVVLGWIFWLLLGYVIAAEAPGPALQPAA